MNRRKFLLATSGAIPVLAIAKNSHIERQAPAKGFVVKATESRFGEKTKLGGKNPNDLKVSVKDTDGKLSIFEYTGNEKGGPPLHIHNNQDEVFFVLEGEYLFRVGEEMHRLKTGDTIFLPRKVPHTFAQLTEKGKVLFLFQPSGMMEDFFREAGKTSGIPKPEQATKIFADHDIQVVGPPLEF